jgi:Membrane-bound lysozyme-inhibitor of c-type lysozyme.
MKKNKILLVISALTLGISALGFAAQTNDAPKTTPTKTTAISKTAPKPTSKPKTTATPKKATTNTPKATTTKPKTNSKVVTNFNCAGQTIKVEYDGEIAKLTNKDGVYTLKVAKAASGALYTNSKGLSIHSSGKDAIYTVGGKDISCDIVKDGTSTKPVTKVVEYNLKGKIKVEFIGQNTAKVTDFSGKTYTLKRAKAASGEYFENENGVSLHIKADEGVFTVKGIDYSFGK